MGAKIQKVSLFLFSKYDKSFLFVQFFLPSHAGSGMTAISMTHAKIPDIEF
jgi:hypothetical protein